MNKVETLTANELKSKLFESIQNNGILDQLKVHILHSIY